MYTNALREVGELNSTSTNEQQKRLDYYLSIVASISFKR